MFLSNLSVLLIIFIVSFDDQTMKPLFPSEPDIPPCTAEQERKYEEEHGSLPSYDTVIEVDGVECRVQST